jgi:hypothetical protein
MSNGWGNRGNNLARLQVANREIPSMRCCQVMIPKSRSWTIVGNVFGEYQRTCVSNILGLTALGG